VRFLPAPRRERFLADWKKEESVEEKVETFDAKSILRTQSEGDFGAAMSTAKSLAPRWREHIATAKLALTAFAFAWIFYASTTLLIGMIWPEVPLPRWPVVALEPFRIADRYGLFAVMTRGRYEIEFQGSNDGQKWTPYPFRYKPQDPREAPGIYAPYQPRFD